MLVFLPVALQLPAQLTRQTEVRVSRANECPSPGCQQPVTPGSKPRRLLVLPPPTSQPRSNPSHTANQPIVDLKLRERHERPLQTHPTPHHTSTDEHFGHSPRFPSWRKGDPCFLLASWGASLDAGPTSQDRATPTGAILFFHFVVFPMFEPSHSTAVGQTRHVKNQLSSPRSMTIPQAGLQGQASFIGRHRDRNSTMSSTTFFFSRSNCVCHNFLSRHLGTKESTPLIRGIYAVAQVMRAPMALYRD